MLVLTIATGMFAHYANAEVYQWVDDKGKVHFGDRPPANARTSANDLSARYESEKPFNVEIIAHDYVLELDVKTKIEVAVAKIFTIYVDGLGLGFDGEAQLKIHIYGNEVAFRNLTRARGLQVENASGFYSPRENAIYVWRNRSLTRLLAVLTHEASHTIMRYQNGRVAAWINEGLAEYFETMEVFGHTVVVHGNEHAADTVKELLETHRLPSLTEFIALPRSQWYAMNGERGMSYAFGWSLCFYLMSSEQGRATMAALLARHREADFSSAGNELSLNVIEANYPGGIRVLEQRWREWALYGKRVAHRY